jgi:hypothetical protein
MRSENFASLRQIHLALWLHQLLKKPHTLPSLAQCTCPYGLNETLGHDKQHENLRAHGYTLDLQSHCAATLMNQLETMLPFCPCPDVNRIGFPQIKRGGTFNVSIIMIHKLLGL